MSDCYQWEGSGFGFAMAMDGAEPRQEPLLAADGAVSAAELDSARLGFHQSFPLRSAKRVFFITQALSFLVVAGALAWATWRAPGFTFGALHFGALLLFATVIGFRLIAAAHLQPILSRIAEPTQWPTYTILCPLYREAHMIPDLIAAIDAIDYPGMVAQSNKPARRLLIAPISGPWPKSALSPH